MASAPPVFQISSGGIFVNDVAGSAESTVGTGSPLDRGFSIYNGPLSNYFVFGAYGTATPTIDVSPGLGLATIPQPPRPPVDFVMNGGAMSGFRIPKFSKPNRPAGKASAPRPREEMELREMMNLYSMWKKAA